MCQSMVNIQSPAAEIRRGKKKKEEEEEEGTNHSMKIYMVSLLHRATIKKKELECGPMPNLMVALPNIGGALCSTPQFD